MNSKADVGRVPTPDISQVQRIFRRHLKNVGFGKVSMHKGIMVFEITLIKMDDKSLEKCHRATNLVKRFRLRLPCTLLIDWSIITRKHEELQPLQAQPIIVAHHSH